MKSIKTKLILFFILLMFLSASLSSFLYTFIPFNNIRDEFKLNQQAIAISILELRQKTDLPLADIIKMASNFMHDVSVIEDIHKIQISEEELEKVQNSEIVFLSSKKIPVSTTVVKVEEDYMQISLQPHNTMVQIVFSRIGFTLVLYVGIGACLIALFSKKAVENIVKLTSAAREVAKGNFDVQIENNSKDEIGQLTKNFNTMVNGLKGIEYLRKDFINSVSHEFKTPIASIQGFAKLLQSEGLPEEERQEYARIIVEETSRLSRLSSNILRLSKLENQDIFAEKKKFDLDEQIRKSILLLEPEWNKKNIEFCIELDKIAFVGDEELLQQVWINLIGNAIKFSETNGNITVKLQQLGSFAKVKIRDEGMGMSEDVQTRIFEKFYQGDKAHSIYGNGLGLSIVKKIVDICGGRIFVKSASGKGTTFIVELPLEKEEIKK